MTLVLEVVSAVLIGLGALFFAAGSVGLLRFPDVYTRLHSLTKADNVGLGLIVAGLAVESGSLPVAAKLVLVWAMVIAAGATAGYLISEAARASGVDPWRRRRS